MVGSWGIMAGGRLLRELRPERRHMGKARETGALVDPEPEGNGGWDVEQRELFSRAWFGCAWFGCAWFGCALAFGVLWGGVRWRVGDGAHAPIMTKGCCRVVRRVRSASVGMIST